jgi:hypothetical protein
MEKIFFDFDFGVIKQKNMSLCFNELYNNQTRRKSKNRNNILGIKQHDKFKVLSKKRLNELLQTARDKLKVGFEIEFNEVPYSAIVSKLKDRGIITDVKSPIKTIYKTQDFYSSNNPNRDKITIQIPEKIDVFKEHELIAYVYNDGSVPLEIVTTAYNLNLFELENNLRKIHNLIHKFSKRATCNCLKGCGLHQTFCFEHKKDKFNRIITANILQICRAFSSGILYLFSFGNRKRRTRDLDFRRLNSSVWICKRVATDKYSFVNNKQDELIEFRWVDGCNSPFLSSLSALFNYAIIKKAIRLSEFGVLTIDSNFFRKNRDITDEFADSKEIDNKFLKFNALKLLSFLKKELSEVGIYDYLFCLFKNPMWKREFNKNSLRSWREQENRIKGIREKEELAGDNELLVLLSVKNHNFERRGN